MRELAAQCFSLWQGLWTCVFVAVPRWWWQRGERRRDRWAVSEEWRAEQRRRGVV